MSRSTVKRVLRDIRNNLYLHVICLVTISLAVFILSAFALFYLNVTELLDAWKKGVRVMVYLADDLSDERRATMESRIKALEGVTEVEFVSKQTAFDALKADIGEQSALLEGLDRNPLPNAFELRLNESFVDLDAIGRLAARIAAMEGVDDVAYAQKWLRQFAGVYNLFQVTGLVLAGMFFLAIVFIVANTIRLILYSRRQEIEIMWIVGADENFIKSPFYIESLLLGLVGGVTGVVFLYLAYRGTVPGLTPEILFSFFEIRFLPASVWAAIIGCSMAVGWAGCHFSIKRFLRV